MNFGMNHLAVQLLGTFVTAVDGVTITRFRSDKIRALLAYLAVESDRPHRREMLANLLWSDWSRRDGLRNLRKSLHRLRQALGEDVSETLLLISQQSVQINAAHLQLDVHQLQKAIADTAQHQHEDLDSCTDCRQTLERGVALYQGEFLHGFALPDALEFTDWMALKREVLHRQLLTALQQIATHYEQVQEFKQAQNFAAQQVALEPWHEAAHRQLMRVYFAAGQRGQALAQYETCRRILAEELGAEPSPTTESLFRSISEDRLEPSEPKADKRQPEIALKRQRHNLPRQFTTFVGRSQEIADILARLQNPACALLTILGPGGVGKTRLATEVAQQGSENYKDGVCFVPLAPLLAVENIAATIADGLGIFLNSQVEVREQLLNYLRAKEMLLVLDNFEHLLGDGVTLLIEILQQSPAVKILVTSRVALNLHAEWLYEIDGLTVPEGVQTDDMGQFTAVQLFHQRVQQVKKPTPKTQDEDAAIVRICQLVEGMPLAVELAASQTHQTSYAEFAKRLAEDMDVLATSMQDLPERQRSLRAIFDYSWQLLNQQERSVLSQLAVFQGGFTVEAADRVTSASLPVLAQLCDKSLLRQNKVDRFDMHEVLRYYAGGKLGEQGEETAVQNKHSAYYLFFIAEREMKLQRAESLIALNEIRDDIVNIRAAWDFAINSGRLTDLAQALNGFAAFYRLLGLPDGTAHLQKAITITTQDIADRQISVSETQRLLARLQAKLSDLLIKQGRTEASATAAQKTITLARQITSVEQEAEGELQWGVCQMHLGKTIEAHDAFTKALRLVQEALNQQSMPVTSLLTLKADILSQISDWHRQQNELNLAHHYTMQMMDIAQETGNIHTQIGGLQRLGMIHRQQGNYAQAKAQYEQAIKLSRTAGNQRMQALLLNNLGLIASDRGDNKTARTYFEEKLAMDRAFGNQAGEGTSYANLGLACIRLGDYPAAIAYYEQSLTIDRETGDRYGQGIGLGNLGVAAMRLGNFARAESLFNESLSLRREVGNRVGEAFTLFYISWLHLHRQAYETAITTSQQAIELISGHSVRDIDGHLHTTLGHAFAGSDRFDEAIVAYQQALTLWKGSGQHHLMFAPWAGLARIALTQNELEQAMAYIEEILLHLPRYADELESTFEPFNIWLTCYRVLAATKDSRANEILTTAHQQIQERVARINDDTLRQSFLENVKSHAEVVAAFNQITLP